MPIAPAMMLRQVAGNIASNGNPAHPGHQVGEFTSKRHGPGHYQITFQNPFTDIISVVATPYAPGSGGNALNSLIVENFSSGTFDLFTVDSNGRNADQAFTFIALGHQQEQ